MSKYLTKNLKHQLLKWFKKQLSSRLKKTEKLTQQRNKLKTTEVLENNESFRTEKYTTERKTNTQTPQIVAHNRLEEKEETICMKGSCSLKFLCWEALFPEKVIVTSRTWLW
jgi:hypothetical protein